MALTFERKPDKGGETNHIGCIGIAAEGAEPTVLLLRTGTDEARRDEPHRLHRDRCGGCRAHRSPS